MTILGTRPELIKMSRVIAALDPLFEQIIVHTGQSFDYELNQVFFEDLNIRKPDVFLQAAGPGVKPMESIAKVLVSIDAALENYRPEAVLIYGDTNSGLSCIAAKRRKVPIFHFEAGNRSFDDRVPEEINRRIIDHTSDINFVLTEHARRYLLAEGISADLIIKTGSHMQEVLAYAQAGIEASTVLTKLNLSRQEYFIVSVHREENVDVQGKLRAFVDSLHRLVDTYGHPVVVSTHPRTRQRLEAMSSEWRKNDRVIMMPPFGFNDYIRLQLDAFCVISDSGTIAEESALLKFPAVTIRDAHERPEGQDGGAVVLTTMHPDRVLDAVRVARATATDTHSLGHVPDYEAGGVSARVARVISGYIDFVNNVVWREQPGQIDASQAPRP